MSQTKLCQAAVWCICCHSLSLRTNRAVQQTMAATGTMRQIVPHLHNNLLFVYVYLAMAFRVCNPKGIMLCTDAVIILIVFSPFYLV